MGGEKAARSPIRVVLVEDHEGTRAGLTDWVNAQSDMKVVAGYSTVAATIEELPGLAPDVAVVDVQLTDGNGLNLCDRLRVLSPSTRCIIHTSVEIGPETALSAGAVAVVLKKLSGDQLLETIRAAGRNGPA